MGRDFEKRLLQLLHFAFELTLIWRHSPAYHPTLSQVRCKVVQEAAVSAGHFEIPTTPAPSNEIWILERELDAVDPWKGGGARVRQPFTFGTCVWRTNTSELNYQTHLLSLCFVLRHY
uniref:IP08721p n=1 Tax=Drosophila melanogaster TaxID=7227 RepID=Q4V492_DROME|nr:IP08721p [Drosophila melanogaster]